MATASVLNKDVDLGLELLADLLIRPVFPQEFVDKEKERTLAEILSAQDRPQVVAGWAFIFSCKKSSLARSHLR